MRNYWSLSKVAKAIRTIFGLPQLPYAASFEEWEAIHEKEQETSKVGMMIIDSLDTIQNAIYFIPNGVASLSYKISNWKVSSHVLRTNTKVGNWQDLVTRIPDALMCSVIDFVEHECFWMRTIWSIDDLPKRVQDYANQSYIRRKLFSMKMTELERSSWGIDWMHKQIDSSPEEQRADHPYHKIIDAYYFAKTKYPFFDAYKQAGWDDYATMTDEQHVEFFANIRAIEKEFSDLVTMHCKNIVEYREYLWT